MQAVILSLISVLSAAPQANTITSSDPKCQAFIASELPQAVAACPGLNLAGSSLPDASVVCASSCQAFIGPFVTQGKAACQNDPGNEQRLSAVQSYSSLTCASTSSMAPSATATPTGNGLKAGVSLGTVFIGAMAIAL